MRPKLFLFCCMLLFKAPFAFGLQASSTDLLLGSKDNFRLIKDADQIKVYHKTEPKRGYVEYKATTMLKEATMENVLLFFMDYTKHTQWVYNCIQSKMWQKKDQKYLYQVCKSPWPFKDRDLSLLVKTTYLDKNTTLVDFISEPEATPFITRKVRIQDFESRWLICQVKDQVSITVQASFDPQLSLANFVLKSYATKIPFETLKNLKAVYHLKM